MAGCSDRRLRVVPTSWVPDAGLCKNKGLRHPATPFPLPFCTSDHVCPPVPDHPSLALPPSPSLPQCSDFNLPKILAQDLVVFNGLLADIFPATDPPRQRDPAFEDVIKSTAIEMGLEPDEEFVHQVVALRWVYGRRRQG